MAVDTNYLTGFDVTDLILHLASIKRNIGLCNDLVELGVHVYGDGKSVHERLAKSIVMRDAVLAELKRRGFEME